MASLVDRNKIGWCPPPGRAAEWTFTTAVVGKWRRHNVRRSVAMGSIHRVDFGVVVPGAAEIAAAGGFLVRATPLLEEEGNALRLALAANLVHPGLLHRPSTWA